MKIRCDLNLSGDGLPSWVIRGKSHSHTTHKKILHTLHDLYMPLTLRYYALVSDLSPNKQKITDLVSKLKICSFFSQTKPTARFKACSVLSSLSKKAPAALSIIWHLS